MSLTDQGKLWVLTLGSSYIPVEKLGKMRKEALYMRQLNWWMRKWYAFALKTAWGITDKGTLEEIVEWLYEDGHRGSYMEALNKPGSVFPKLQGGAFGFDASRAAQIVYRGVSVGYLSSEEGWSFLEKLGRFVQPAFSTWREYGESYIAGLDFWCKSNDIHGNDVQSAKKELESWLANSKHPCVYLDWNTAL